MFIDSYRSGRTDKILRNPNNRFYKLVAFARLDSDTLMFELQ